MPARSGITPHMMARGMSQPSVMFKGTLQDGRTVMVKDYAEAYHQLRDNTLEDSPRHGVVGLRLSDRGHGQPHFHRRR